MTQWGRPKLEGDQRVYRSKCGRFMITHRFDQKGAVFVLVGTAIPRTFKMLREAQEYVRDFEG